MQLLMHKTGYSVMLLWLNAALYGATVKVRFLKNPLRMKGPTDLFLSGEKPFKPTG